ncbi:hypothetical protein AGMMS49950_11400 [Endomicrobiia bacterium]|nr:hypothetical protein AGMMS49950_11400 [Endomicrobiia bacterium]
MTDTIKLWEDVVNDVYDILISDITMAEISRCPEPKRSFMRSTLANIKYEEVKHNIESENLSEKYLKGCGLP